MARKEIKALLNDNELNKLNHNFKEIYDEFGNVVNTVSEKAFDKVVDSAKLNWKEPVSSSNNLPSKASEGDTIMTRNDGKVYRYDGSNWNEIQDIDPSAINEVDNRLSSQLADIATNVKKPPIPMVGAKGDGETDDTEAIQGSMDYVANSGGGMVYFPAGEYLISKTINIKGDNISVIGDDFRCHIRINKDENAFLSNGNDNLWFSKLRITGNKDASDDSYSGGGNAIAVYNGNNINVRNNFIKEFKGKSIHFSGFDGTNLSQGVHDGWIMDNFIEHCGDGIMVYNDGRRVEVSGNIIYRCTNIGIYIDDSHQIDGLEIPRVTTRINVENNHVNSMLGTTGINFAGTQYSSARGNYIFNGGQGTTKNVNGISIQTVQNHVPAKHNIIEGNTIVGHTNSAIDLIGASYNIIRNNNLINNSLNRRTGGSQSISLQSNVVRDVLFGSNHNIIENNKSFVDSEDSTLGTHIKIVDENNIGNIIRFNKMDGGVYAIGDDGASTIKSGNIFNEELVEKEAFEDGEHRAPSIHFASDPDSGFYKRADGEWGFVSNGERVVYFRKGMTFVDGNDVQFGTDTGSRFGTSPRQKMAFWGATPIAQPVNIPQTSAATLAELEQEVNKLKYLLSDLGLMS